MMEPIRAILNCHPNEIVGNRAGELTIEELKKRGFGVDVIRMPSVVEIDGQKVPWYMDFTTLEGINRRGEHERRIAEEVPDLLTVTFHDGPAIKSFIEDGRQSKCNIRQEDYATCRLATIELWTPMRKPADPERLALAERSRETLKYSLLGYLDQESVLDHPWSQDLISPPSIGRLADLVEEVQKHMGIWMSDFEGTWVYPNP